MCNENDKLNLEKASPTTVLVVEDEPITRQLLKKFLREKGFDVLTAPDGETAWKLFKEHRPRLVITDWRMPKMDGFQLCKAIRSEETAEYTYLLVLTSTTDHDAMVDGFSAGADDFMTKPFDKAELAWRMTTGERLLSLQNSLETRIRQLDEAHRRLSTANEAMQEGLSAAAKTQQAMLPQKLPEVKGIDGAWSYVPSDHLGGDSLNMFRLDEHRFGFFVADVCGHGLPSALLAVSLHRVLTPSTGQANLLVADENRDPIELFSNPGAVLTEVNRRFPVNIEDGEYFTCVYGVIDSKNSKLHFAGAGHPSPIIQTKDGQFKKLCTDGFPIGFDDSMEYELQTVSLAPGDRLLAYTDGFIETVNDQGEMFGQERLTECLGKTRGSLLRSSLDALNGEISDWAGQMGQQDDLSLILLEFVGVPNEASQTSSIQPNRRLAGTTTTRENEEC